MTTQQNTPYDAPVTLTPDYASSRQRSAVKCTLLSGSVSPGDVLGEVTGSFLVTVTASNVGDGSLNSAAIGPNVKPGVYRVACVVPSNSALLVNPAAVFSVTDPDGVTIGAAVVGTAFAGAVRFTIAESGDAFVVGDAFSIVVRPAGLRLVRPTTSAAVDGTQSPKLLAGGTVDATSAPKDLMAYVSGDFDDRVAIVPSGFTLDQIRAALAPHGITLVAVA